LTRISLSAGIIAGALIGAAAGWAQSPPSRLPKAPVPVSRGAATAAAALGDHAARKTGALSNRARRNCWQAARQSGMMPLTDYWEERQWPRAS